MKEQAPVFRLVLPPRLCQASYHATRTEFLCAAQRAAHNLRHGTGRHWFLDGHTSDTLHLRLSCEGLNLGTDCLQQDIDFQVGSGTVTIRLLSRLPSVLDIFNQFAQQLSLDLPRRSAG
ncbi:hypothetical protein HNQ08_002788 [Deinococcus humi]|uniref:Uncharacterized protein n=1 Tax=Deinococcus humi TaxID=662880 RepID=A0A7W8JUV3_9DEIO|nr:hypothetical protein [Deinococcus humi]GGO29787.1 hypothetical protein GCM10008949_23750 [Deinococcus humi]